MELKGNRTKIYLRVPFERFRDVVRFIDHEFNKKVYLIGSKALYESGVYTSRPLDDIDLYSTLTLQERIRLKDYVRKKYQQTYDGLARSHEKVAVHILGDDVSKLIAHIYDRSWDERIIEINGVETRIPPLEDLLLTKMLSPRIKDRQDVQMVLLRDKNKIDLSRLKMKAEKLSFLKDTNRL